VSSLLNLILSTPVLADYTQFRSDVKFFRFYFLLRRYALQIRPAVVT
jgi:hypothetical protein